MIKYQIKEYLIFRVYASEGYYSSYMLAGLSGRPKAYHPQLMER